VDETPQNCKGTSTMCKLAGAILVLGTLGTIKLLSLIGHLMQAFVS